MDLIKLASDLGTRYYADGKSLEAALLAARELPYWKGDRARAIKLARACGEAAMDAWMDAEAVQK